MGTGEEEYYVDASSEEFTNVVYSGEECPLTEIDGKVNGTLRIALQNPLNSTIAKIARLIVGSLRFGEEEASVHDGNEEPMSVLLEEVNGKSWGVHLAELPGCPGLC